ncbi:MAG: peptide chain release factor H [Desulfobacteraceae bacterium]
MMKWVQLTSGRGPEECEFAVKNILEVFVKQAHGKGFETTIVETAEGMKKNTLKSALISIDGKNPDGFIHPWEGTIQWIGQSPFRPSHKRKNWYIRLVKIDPPDDDDAVFRSDDIKVETMKSAGPGGQHANKTDSAVRITHVPTGITMVSKGERSQVLNKKLAFARLKLTLDELNKERDSDFSRNIWSSHNRIERGNPVKIFKGRKFKEV